MQTRRMLRTPDAGVYLGDVATSTLEKWRVSGTGPRFTRLGRIVVYDIRDLDAFIDARKRASTSERGPERAA